jgi:hypothetical protein
MQQSEGRAHCALAGQNRHNVSHRKTLGSLLVPPPAPPPHPQHTHETAWHFRGDLSSTAPFVAHTPIAGPGTAHADPCAREEHTHAVPALFPGSRGLLCPTRRDDCCCCRQLQQQCAGIQPAEAGARRPAARARGGSSECRCWRATCVSVAEADRQSRVRRVVVSVGACWTRKLRARADACASTPVCAVCRNGGSSTAQSYVPSTLPENFCIIESRDAVKVRCAGRVCAPRGALLCCCAARRCAAAAACRQRPC